MTRCTGNRTLRQKARRDGAVSFALVALITLAFGESQLQLLREDGPLILTIYLMGVAAAGAAGAASARWYLEAEFPAAAIIISPILSLGAAIALPALLFPATGLGPFSFLVIVASPVLLGGGLIASFLMYRKYG